ncbi:hypothetical protein D6774_01605 [Candidatus Woesearchaeota archaeon]|jgi:16S rRNA (guanine(1405)-N(7))-methyltransferase|nr:MAG: hypothetical protein D6774_01605 [Candidatus Woesearchaeota archaeon]
MNKALEEYVAYIKGKDYAGISDETILDLLTPFLAQNKKLRSMLNDFESFEPLRRNKQIALTAKKVREHLRKVYGSYHTKQSKKVTFLLNNLKKAVETKGYAQTEEEHKELIKAHRSTKERAEFIDEFYKRIFEETGLPASIVDIACGLNPLTAFWMAPHEMIPVITGYELSDWEVKIINEYAKICDLPITAKRCDLNMKIPQIRAECLFALKFFELISTKRVEQIITSAQVNWIVASYPTKTLKREKMTKTTRAWFHLLLKRLEYPYKLLHFENEIVYIIKKQ